jgi:hypothetical protein
MAGVSEEKGAGPGELGTPGHRRISQDSYFLHYQRPRYLSGTPSACYTL